MKILIADDDRVSGLILKRQVQSLGFDPILVTDGHSAFDILTGPDSPNIAILDWMMPEMSGIEIIENLKTRDGHDQSNLYIIILTSKSRPEDLSQALYAGADDFIVKPFNPKELKARLEVGRRIVNLTSDLMAAKDEAKRLAEFAQYYDIITGLPNRFFLAKEMQQMDFSEKNYAFILTNIDNFKIVNQIYGMDSGDKILKHCGQLLKKALGEDILVARMGADEFASLLPLEGNEYEVVASQIMDAANKIQTAIHKPIKVGEDNIELTVCNGVSILQPNIATDFKECFRRADLALKRAKKKGVGCTVIHDPEAERELQEQYRLKRDLISAISNRDEIVIFLQPQFSVDRQLKGAEVLVRWIHPKRGLIPPGMFIPIAEEDDLIVDMGRLVMEKACQFLSNTRECPIKLAVNISPRQFQQPDFTREVLDILAKTGANPKNLVLEVTEGLFMAELDPIIHTMKELTKVGIEFSIDDFGTGFSSLMYLKRLPVSELKIDRAFIKDLPHDKNDEAIVKTVFDIANNLDFRLVAEGVETEEHIQFLSSLGNVILQGFYFSKPEPVDIFVEKFCK